MPPASRNQRAPTAGDTPAPTAASSLDWPAAIAAQNRSRCSRRATPGRPGDRNTLRNARSERRFRGFIATPSVKVLRRPPESARYGSISEMAAAEKIERGYLGSLPRLTLLAPGILEAILDGRQPEGLGLPQLLAGFAETWSEQYAPRPGD
jgi:hypothetical protein